MRLTRITLLASASASLAAPAIAQVDPLAAALTRARSFDQLRSLIVKVDGETRVADAIRGPALERPANIKSVSKSIVAVLTGIAIGVPLITLSSAKRSSIVSAAFLGAYTFIFAVDFFVGGSAKYILLNLVRRATVPDFNLAVIATPFQVGP